MANCSEDTHITFKFQNFTNEILQSTIILIPDKISHFNYFRLKNIFKTIFTFNHL